MPDLMAPLYLERGGCRAGGYVSKMLHRCSRWKGGREMAAGTEIRSKRISVALRPEVYERVKAAADDVGLSVNAWVAYTIGSAAMSHAALREKMTDGMVALMREAVTEAETNGVLAAALVGEHGTTE